MRQQHTFEDGSAFRKAPLVGGKPGCDSVCDRGIGGLAIPPFLAGAAEAARVGAAGPLPLRTPRRVLQHPVQGVSQLRASGFSLARDVQQRPDRRRILSACASALHRSAPSCMSDESLSNFRSADIETCGSPRRFNAGGTIRASPIAPGVRGRPRLVTMARGAGSFSTPRITTCLPSSSGPSAKDRGRALSLGTRNRHAEQETDQLMGGQETLFV